MVTCENTWLTSCSKSPFKISFTLGGFGAIRAEPAIRKCRGRSIGAKCAARGLQAHGSSRPHKPGGEEPVESRLAADGHRRMGAQVTPAVDELLLASELGRSDGRAREAGVVVEESG